jgi:type II secretory pathway component PulM
MKEWYLRQNSRDRMIVIALGVLVALSLLYLLAWYPLQSKLSRTESAISSKSETLDFIRTGSARLKAAGGVQSESKTTNKATYQLIDDIRGKHQVARADRIDPTNNNGARVSFSDVKFDNLVKMLAELESYGVTVSIINITRKDAPGMVSARITMEKS